MRISLLAALAAAALINGCTTTSSNSGYAGYDDRAPPPGDAYYDRRVDDGSRYAGRDDRIIFSNCMPGDCPPRDFFVQPLPPDYRGPEVADDYRRPEVADDYRRPETADDYRRPEIAEDYRDRRRPKPAPAAIAADGQWRVQLGVFRDKARATALRARLAGTPALARHHTYLVVTGGMTRVQAGPLASSTAAQNICARVRAGGHACIVKAS